MISVLKKYNLWKPKYVFKQQLLRTDDEVIFFLTCYLIEAIGI